MNRGRTRNWCDLCRESEAEIKCLGDGCWKRFHSECLRIADMLQPDDDLENYTCLACRDQRGNDDFCYKCQKSEEKKPSAAMLSKGALIMCDGCPRSAHMQCMKLAKEPDGQRWFCPVCDPQQGKKTVRVTGGGKKKLGNVDICYVCQSGGKLLGCDECEQSFHPRCLTLESLEFEKDVWKCPLCCGNDPLVNMAHKRLTRNQRAELSAEKQECVNREYKRCRKNRDRFLYNMKEALRPFVRKGVLEKLKKSAGVTSNEVEDEESEEEKESERRFLDAERKARNKGTTVLREGVILKPYQRCGVAWLLHAFDHKAGATLADEMGLGKTIQTLAFLSALKALGISGPHLVVVPLSTVGNWAREIRKFTPHLTFTHICGSKQERRHSMNDPVAEDGLYDVTITTYETVTAEEAFFADTINWQTIILDEAHRIKSQTARIRHSLDRISANMRVLLTGTPLQNNIKELFTLLNFLFPDILKDSEEFEAAFQLSNVREAHTAVTDDAKIQAINDLLSRLLLRRTKDLVVTLPSKIAHEIWLPLAPVAVEWYQRLLDIIEYQIDSESTKKLMGSVIKMRICSCHPRGLVYRDAQLLKLKEAVKWLPFPKLVEDVNTGSDALRAAKGWEHVMMSAKLVFLDKLITTLHQDNMKHCDDYRIEFEHHRREKLRDLIMSKEIPTDVDIPLVDLVDGMTQEEVDEKLRSLDPCHYEVDNQSTREQFMSNVKLDEGDAYNPQKRMHRLLVFTQFQLVLDELQEYCQWRGWKYLRLDGSTNKFVRELDIREFNADDSTYMIFLVCTRAGGVGINLTSANNVVMFDEDWNPFVDLQAIDRAHRIGQQRDVSIWKLMTEWTVEELMAIRRSQKLKLDKLVVQAHVESAEIDPEELSAKISGEEIRRLLRYGTDAVRSLTKDNCDKLDQYSLDDFIQRKRKPIPDVFQHENLEVTEDIPDEDLVDVIDIVREEVGQPVEVSLRTPSPEASDLPPECLTDADPSKSAEASSDIPSQGAVAEDGTVYPKRTMRVRRRPQLVYNPIEQLDRVKTERKLNHEKRCFRCMESTNQKPSEKIPEPEPAVPCSRCPKTYHSGCVDVEPTEIKKSWVCPWHECALCFRKSSAAGGLLIHCAECPTAFCFDCFPPEYRRHVPGVSFFRGLQRRGWNISEAKMIFFICSRCKAVREQNRRKKMSRQQLDSQLRIQREENARLREEAKKSVENRHTREEQKEQKKILQEKKKREMEHRRLIDDMERQLELELRDAYTEMFPSRYLQEIKERKAVLLAQEAEETNPQQKRAIGRMLHQTKLPHETLRLCDSCHCPGHDINTCPFPPEVIKREVTPSTQWVDVGDSTDPVPKDPEFRPDGRKLQQRQFCSKCGTVARQHTRRHCPMLTEEEQNMYDKKRDNLRTLIDTIKQVTLEAYQEPYEILRKTLPRSADNMVIQKMRENGMEKCIHVPVRRMPKPEDDYPLMKKRPSPSIDHFPPMKKFHEEPEPTHPHFTPVAAQSSRPGFATMMAPPSNFVVGSGPPPGPYGPPPFGPYAYPGASPPPPFSPPMMPYVPSSYFVPPGPMMKGPTPPHPMSSAVGFPITAQQRIASEIMHNSRLNE